MALELYWGSGSPYAWAVMLGLELKGIPYTSHVLEFSKKEHKTPEMLKMNPRGKIPVLKDGDFVVCESLAILYYLEKKVPNPSLFGKEPEEAARIMQRVSEIMSYVNRPFMECVGPILFKAVAGKEQKIRDKAKFVHDELQFFNHALRTSKWLCGEQICVADLLFYPQVKLLLRGFSKDEARPFADLGFGDLQERYPRMVQWMTEIERLPGYAKTYPPHWK